jgi:GT2 family glycosyltransferase
LLPALNFINRGIKNLVDWANIATPHRGVDEVDVGRYDQLEEIEFVSFCAALIKKEVFAKISLLEKKYFLYYEDADFCQRALRAGFKLFYVPRAKVWHQVAASSQIGGDLHDYFFARNQLLFGWRFAPWRSKLALAKQSLRHLFFGRSWQKKGVIDFYLKKFGQGRWLA